jgi:hypothetical protein
VPGPTETPSPTTTSPPPDFTTVGYVGCSNSAGSVDGYHLDGGTLMWPFIRNYGSGTTTTWAANIGGASDEWWAAFTRQQGITPAGTFWFQLCPRAAEDQDNDDEARAVIAEIRNQVPGAVVYVSALNTFEVPCSIAGPQGPANSQADVDDLVASGDALEGPVMPQLQADQVQTDGCHPNTSGRALLGDALLEFFG